MAKGKIFSDGQPLTAADVNTYLNPDVISTGIAYNSGWKTDAFTLGSARLPSHGLRVRRLGLSVEVAGHIIVDSNELKHGTVLLTMVTGYRPPVRVSCVAWVRLVSNHRSNHVICVEVMPDGRFLVSGEYTEAADKEVCFNFTYGIG